MPLRLTTKLARTRPLFLGAAALAALALVIAVSLGMHRGLLLSSDIKSRCWPWVPFLRSETLAAPGLSDPVWQFVPWLSLARRQLAAGGLPLWNPHQDGGVPLLGNAISALLSPLVWPALLLGVAAGWNLSLLLRILLAAGATYAWLRDLSRSRWASALGAVAFALSGAFVAWLEHPHTLVAAAVPLLLLFGRRVARGGAGSDIVGFGLSTFLVLAGGHPESALMAALLVLAASAFDLPSAQRLAAMATGSLLGAGLAAPALFPFIEYFRLSEAHQGAGRHPFVLPARDLLRFVWPPLDGSNVIEAAATVSVIVLLLLPFGFAAARRDPETRFWVLASAAMLLAIYDNPVSRLLARATPVYWTRFLLLLPLALGAVAAAGLDVLRERLGSRHGAIARAIGPAAVVVCLAELLSAARGVHAVTPAAWLAPRTPLLDRLAADRDVFRILPLHTMLSPNSATDYGLDDVRGYDALGPAGWRRARARIGRFADLPTQRDAIEPWDLVPGGAALDDWNVKYLLLPPTYGFGAETINARKGLDLAQVYAGPDGRILENRRVRPRARLEGAGAAGETRILERTAGRWRIETHSSASASLVVADPFFPGWRAHVDGAAVRLTEESGEPLRVDLAPGRHEVELTYRPGAFSVGVFLAVASAAAVAVLLARGRRA